MFHVIIFFTKFSDFWHFYTGHWCLKFGEIRSGVQPRFAQIFSVPYQEAICRILEVQNDTDYTDLLDYHTN